MYDKELVDLLVAVRDSLAELLKAVDAYLDSLKPPELRGEELEGLGWTSYTTKQAATAEEAAWAFTSERDGRTRPEVEPLLKVLRISGGRVTVGGYEYRLSGDGRFIQRRPLK